MAYKVALGSGIHLRERQALVSQVPSKVVAPACVPYKGNCGAWRWSNQHEVLYYYTLVGPRVVCRVHRELRTVSS